MDRIFRHSQSVERFRFGDLNIGSLLFADDVVLLAPSICELQLSLDRFTAEGEAAAMRISSLKSAVTARKKLSCHLRVGEVIPPQVEEFKYLGVLFTSEGKREWEIDRHRRSSGSTLPRQKSDEVVRASSRATLEGLCLLAGLGMPRESPGRPG